MTGYEVEKEITVEVLERPEIVIENDEVTFTLGSEFTLPAEIKNNLDYEVLIILENDNVVMTSEIFKANKVGSCILTIEIKGITSKQITINIIPDKSLELSAPKTALYLDQVNVECISSNLEGDASWQSSDESVATVEDGIVTSVGVGLVTISCIWDGFTKEVSIFFDYAKAEQIVVDGLDSIVMLAKGTYQLNVNVLPENANQEFTIRSSNLNVAMVDSNGLITAVLPGSAQIEITASNNITKTIEVLVEDKAPEFIFNEGITQNRTVNYNDNYNPTSDLKLIDDVDGDITSNIEVKGEVDTRYYKTYTVTLSAKDSGGNKVSLTREITVIWPYSVKFIGHAGCYYGIMNSEEAFIYAAKELHYQALECDVKQTKDGVFVVCHDNTFNGLTIAEKTWDELKDVTETKSRNAGIPSQNGSVVNSPYTTKLCTLERYLEICKEYNISPVIELKSSNGITNSDQSRMQALVDEITRCGMMDKAIFLGSQYNCLIWLRNNGYNNICQYLVNSLESDTTLERCITYNFEVSINVIGNYSNGEEWIARYKEADIKISTYTFTQYVDYPVVQEWIDKGVDYVTCDWQLIEKLNLPLIDTTPKPKYKVVFTDDDGTILKETEVVEGKTAAPPKEPTKEGYIFKGWDQEIKNITKDMTIKAVYEINTYTITYVSSLVEAEEVAWESKEAFVNELYGDLIEWCKTNGKNVSGLSESNGTFTLVKNGVTVSFATVSDILKIDKYDFEKTLANLFFKPLVRLPDGGAVIEADENYFINSDAYRTKYKNLDSYLMNALKNAYSHYDKTYTPTSAGKIQILFRFHQWVQGTSIPAFNKYPTKFDVKAEVECTLPDGPFTYTILDSFELKEATSKYKFLGWYLDEKCEGEKVTSIALGTTGNIILYAKWDN